MDARGNRGSRSDGRHGGETRRVVARPEGRTSARGGDGANRSGLGDVGSAHARDFHQRPAVGRFVDVTGAFLTAIALAGALLGCSGCAGSDLRPCSAWNTGRAAACAVCALPACGDEVGAGEVLEDPESCEVDADLR